jgi:hypothetical protein
MGANLQANFKLDKSTLLKRARAKYLSSQLSIKLLSHNPESSICKSYRNTFYCADKLLQVGKELTTQYCKNRWCAVCNRIRTGKLINGYFPQLRQLKEPYFLTLTKPTVSEFDLQKSMDKMGEVWRKIMVSKENQNRRKVKGLRKSECTIRPDGHYHFHFHVLIDGKDNAEWVVSEWIKRMEGATRQAQDIRPANEQSLKELFKYFTKLTTKIDDKRELIEYTRMDVIFRAMYGKRVFQPFGGLKMFSEEIEDLTADEYDFLEDCQKTWKWHANDWIDEFGECLTGYSPNEQIKVYFEPKKLSVP